MVKKRNVFKEASVGYLFLLPSLVSFGVFLFYPFFMSIYLSLHSTNLVGKIYKFVGFENYVELLGSAHFHQSLGRSLVFALMTVPASMILALVFAILTYKKKRYNVAFQFLFAISIAMPAGMASVIWKFMFHPTAGILNYFIGKLGISPIGWLTDPAYAMMSVSIMTIWLHIGFAYLIILSGIKGIPEDMFESARIDGAGSLNLVFKIMLPLLSPTLLFLSVISVIGSLQTFGQIKVLTEGGPMKATNVVVYDLYNEAFVNYRFGSGSAQAIVLFVILLLLTLVQFQVTKRRVHYS